MTKSNRENINRFYLYKKTIIPHLTHNTHSLLSFQNLRLSEPQSTITFLYLCAMKNLFYIVSVSLLFAACGGTEPIQKEQTSATTSKNATQQQQQTKQVVSHDLDYDLDKYRNSLADLNTTKNNNLPQQLVVEASQPVERNDFTQNGYRIQLVSTSDRSRAEKVIADFNDWLFANESIRYKAESYIIFRQPNYRVHVGDFKSRIQATEFNKLVKRRFSDAWIIQDQINEDKTPDNME
ncbi:SPOR domain-containing protein [bacterium]|nr:MAG: SPOR domain-containing protein [bacterium]